MTFAKPEGYDPEEQEGFDEYVPDLVDAIELGYFDAHLKVVARAIFTRRGVIDGVDYSVPVKRRPAGMKATPKPHAAIGGGGSATVTMGGSNKPGDIFEITMTDPGTGAEVPIGKVVVDRDGNQHKIKQDKFQSVPDWYDRTVEVGKYKYQKQQIKDSVLALGTHESVPAGMVGKYVQVLEVGRKTLNVRLLNFPKYRSGMRSNSVFVKAWENNALVKVPVDVFIDYFE